METKTWTFSLFGWTWYIYLSLSLNIVALPLFLQVTWNERYRAIYVCFLWLGIYFEGNPKDYVFVDSFNRDDIDPEDEIVELFIEDLEFCNATPPSELVWEGFGWIEGKTDTNRPDPPKPGRIA